MRLPFIQAPKEQTLRKLGNADSGIIEMPVLGGLTVGESAILNELLVDEATGFSEAAKLADAISKAENISISEAYNVIESVIGGQLLEEAAEGIKTRHADAIRRVAQIYTSAGQLNQEAVVTALIASRCNLQDWSLQDTRKLPRVLFTDIYELAQQEIAAEGAQASPPTDEELGKQRRAKRKPSESTGPASSTN